MSWVLLNIVLALECFVIYLIIVNVNNILRLTDEIRHWLLPLNEEDDDIREEMFDLCYQYDERGLGMLRNFRFIIGTAFLVVLANMNGNPVVWIPFWASVGFTLESILNLRQINLMGYLLNYNVDLAQTEMTSRALAKTEKLGEAAANQVDEKK